jgi:glycerophosphoryl diester phosphodiesterase
MPEADPQSGQYSRHTSAPKYVVAHRAANTLEQLIEAVGQGASVVEADLQWYHGRIELRHLKTVGPLPIFWDQWYLANPFRRYLRLEELLEELPQGVELILDLKGRSRRLAREALAQITPLLDRGVHITVCARHWPLLQVFQSRADVRCVYSVGKRRQLERLLHSAEKRPFGGISIHQELLDRETIARVIEAAETVMTWPVNSEDRARELLAQGVHGLISDHPSRVFDATTE